MSRKTIRENTPGDVRSSPSTPPKLWLLKLTLPGKYGRLLTSLMIFCVLLAIFYRGAYAIQPERIPAIFFSLVIAYIIPVFSYITERSQETVQQLQPVLNLNEEQIRQRQNDLQYAGLPLTLFHLCLGTLLGGAHMSLVAGSPRLAIAQMLSSVPDFLSIVGSLLVWIIMTTVIAMLIRQAVVIGRLGADNVSLQLLDTQRLLPFGRVAISSSLAIIGALALFPIIGVEIGVDLMQILPGAIAILFPLVVIFLMPLWPVQRRMSRLKDARLNALNNWIARHLNNNSEQSDSTRIDTELTALLVYRREILEVSTWPFNLSHVARFAFYLVIPPLTWVAAALIDNLVDAVL